MIVVHFKGGLGNQLFQYAAGKSLAERHGVPLRFDTSWYDDPLRHNSVIRRFDLSAFSIEGEMASGADVAPFHYNGKQKLLIRSLGGVARLFSRCSVLHYDGIGWKPKFDRLGEDVYLDGYFQHPKYFLRVQDKLRLELQLRSCPPEAVLKKATELGSISSVGIQVRRTDFVSGERQLRFHGVCSLDYFRSAWDLMRKRIPDAVGLVFSDDPEWALHAFYEWPDVTVISPEWDGPNYLHKFYLIRSCRHFVIANSTWGWWSAWLGAYPEKIVVMPKRWFADDTANSQAVGLRMPGWHTC